MSILGKNRQNTAQVESTPLSVDDARKAGIHKTVENFLSLPPEDFFAKTGKDVSFNVALPKQGALEDVLRPVLNERLGDGDPYGRFIAKCVNQHTKETYCIDTETGVVFGMLYMKPGEMIEAFNRADNHGNLGTICIDSDIDKTPAPLIGIMGKDTFEGKEISATQDMSNIIPIKTLNTSHSALYMAAKDKQFLEDIGKKDMKIAVSKKYLPALEVYFENCAKTIPSFKKPELMPCTGSTESEIKRYRDINVYATNINRGHSALNAGVQYVRILNRSQAVVLARDDLEQKVAEDRISAINAFVQTFSGAVDEHFKHTFKQGFSESTSTPSPKDIFTIEELFKDMNLDIKTAREDLKVKDDRPFYGATNLAAWTP